MAIVLSGEEDEATEGEIIEVEPVLEGVELSI